MWHVYILKCADKTLYTGITTDIKRRTEEHNSSVLGAKYTRNRRPVILVYSRRYKSRSAAAREEWRLKQLPRVEKLKIINHKNK
ncbi:endonuclease [Candidatus Falkowbacteria bacterium RIFOXYB2_FULL_47_14]|uniref:Endonuclease n=1 Tax=Candidatus Falkowbacteria bacterium RIFOXYA2_FULL_47_19 TaxID=1797994 RepID=A0A1F5SJX9_9BACT|nr:MAG: endonuclease [Candidatus Falkowbacteria bacterium RIFOXYA2_FULL_47_19]OGF35746.1 MAG: endonuclease [Candidatus Falkowbacteria bacterium RIFOXYC2_FULL_46_15]OGF43304.1 MAG: endonuclease [Candidatus Falkowbacteria bacterium RIFOXYB2_FULL_47_14]